MYQSKPERLIVGALEDVGLPEWGIKRIRARVDTGARTSAVHAEDIKLLPRDRIQFYIIVGWKGPRKRKRVKACIKKTAHVRTSSGKGLMRFVVETTLLIGPIKKKIEITLAERDKMRFRMLLGRNALAHDFLVDPSHHCLLSRERKG